MATPKKYVVHPGYVLLYSDQRQGITTKTYIDAGTLASYYGLSFGEYDTSITQQQSSQDGAIIQTHLFPRPDGKYQNIKVLYGDNGTDNHIDKMVNWRKHRAERDLERRKYI